MINLKYIPNELTKKDRILQTKMLLKSKQMYNKSIYYNRKTLKSYSNKKSPHILKAKQIYKVNKISATKDLVKATGCSKKALLKIINKGEGAYYSSGSRPNQTAKSWGLARLASSITSGKAAVKDYIILKKGCKNNSKALQLAKKAKQKYNFLK